MYYHITPFVLFYLLWYAVISEHSLLPSLVTAYIYGTTEMTYHILLDIICCFQPLLLQSHIVFAFLVRSLEGMSH